jgi:excisionase family DNA binding protein
MKKRVQQTRELDPKITFGEVAGYLGVGRRMVLRLIKEGLIRARKDPLDSRLKRESSKK